MIGGPELGSEKSTGVGLDKALRRHSGATKPIQNRVSTPICHVQ